jgi:hypothetical protein
MMSDLKRLKTEAAASTGELREFIRGLKGRSPQEVMGIVSGNSLMQGLVMSVVGCAALLIVLSVPFAFGHPSKPKGTKSKPAETAQAESAATNAAATTAAQGDVPSEANLQRASKAMGLDETKTVDPKTNPLDKLDNLLDKVP